MGIWIRTQDKEHLLEVSNIYKSNCGTKGVVRGIDVKCVSMVIRSI